MEIGDAGVGRWPHAVGGYSGTILDKSQVGKWRYVVAKVGTRIAGKEGYNYITKSYKV